MIKNLILIAIPLLLIIAGCAEVHPHQDKIDMIDTKSQIKMSNWNVEEFDNGFIITADSYDDSAPAGMRTGRPIWYIEKNNIYWVNGKAKSISHVYNEAPDEIQDAILHPNTIKKEEGILEDWYITKLNETLLFDYDEEWGEYAIAVCDYGGHHLYGNPGLNRGGSIYKFQVCYKQIQIKILKEAVHKELGDRYYFVEVDGYQGWMSSGDLDKYNKLMPYEKRLKEDEDFRRRVEYARKVENSGVDVELYNPDWTFRNMSKVVNYKDTIGCFSKGFGLHEELPAYGREGGGFKFGGKKFATANPCEKTLVLKVIKEATHKENGIQCWLVEFEGQIGWVDKREVTNTY